LPVVTMGRLRYVATLIAAIGFVQVGLQARADRYTYLPLVGVFIMIAWGVPKLARSRGIKVRVLVAPAVVALGALTVVAYTQVETWRDSEAVYRQCLLASGNNWFAHSGLGCLQEDRAAELVARGNPQEADRLNREAVEHFQQVLAVLPQFADAHNNLARGLGAIGRKDEAIEEYQETLRLDPNHAPAHSNLAGALLNQGKVDEAIAHYQRALEIDPEYVDAHYNIAIAYKVRGEPDNSIEHYRIVLGLHPNAFFAYLARNDIALILMHKGEVEEALRLLREAASINETARVDLVKDAARRNLALFGKE